MADVSATATPAAAGVMAASDSDTAACADGDTAAPAASILVLDAAGRKAQWQSVRLIFAKRLDYYCPQIKDILRAMLWQPLVVGTAAADAAASTAAPHATAAATASANADAGGGAGAGGGTATGIDKSKPLFLSVETLAGIAVARLQADPMETVENFKRRLAEAVKPRLDPRMVRLFRCACGQPAR